MVVATIPQSKSSLWSVTRFNPCSKNTLVNSCTDTKPAVHKDFLPPKPWTDNPEQQQALLNLQARLSNSTHGCPDEDTLKWFLRDSEFNVSQAEGKLKTMLTWRAKHRFLDVTLDDVYAEYKTGKAVLHHHTDQFGRPTLIVRSSKHSIGEYPVEDSKRLATFMLDSAVKSLPAAATGVGEQLLLVIDLNNISMSNIDLLFVAFVVDTIPEHFPRRIGQVLFVDAPWVFKAPWEACKHMLRKYAALVRFISSKQLAEEYFTPETLPDIFKK